MSEDDEFSGPPLTYAMETEELNPFRSNSWNENMFQFKIIQIDSIRM